MKKLPAVAPEDLGKVMEEVVKELKPLLSRLTREEDLANITFFGTLSALTLNIFDYLPPEQQEEILINCGTWFDIGMLLGKSPQLLVEILERVKPKVVDIEIPDWLIEGLTRAPKQEGED